MKIGIFGGSFDPVHIGHVALAVALIEAKKLDLVYIIPANTSPFKKNGRAADAKSRLHMCRLAFRDVPKCKVLDIEIKRGGVQYTIDTVHELFARQLVSKKDSLYLLLGEDSFESLPKWKQSDELLQLVTPIVAKRGAHHANTIQTPLFEVSATEIRDREHKGLYTGHLLPKSVYNYIQRHNLYHE